MNTTIYIDLGNGEQVQVVMTHQSDPIPTPNEITRERELTAAEFITVSKKLSEMKFSTLPIY